MRINVHAHIFNLQTVLTEEAIGIIAGRLARIGFPPLVVDGARRFLTEQLSRPELLVEEDLLRRFIGAITQTSGFRELLGTAEALPVEIRILGDGASGLATDTLRGALDRLSSYLEARDRVGKSLFDLYETLRLAMQPDVVGVADRLLEHMRTDDALVALMMDIVAPNEKRRDRANWMAQIRGTADAAVQRPGRVLPFIAVNPIRPDHFAFMRRAIEEMGFLGVKLYPSLGFRVTSPEIGAVLDYCVAQDVPVLMHCTVGGFFKAPETTDFSHPRHWDDLLAPRSELRICFAHCGGWAGLSRQDPDQQQWADEIFRLMEKYPAVYTDLSYHVQMMRGGVPEQRYLDALRALLASDPFGARIMFGTDSWLLRLDLTDESFWRYFEASLTPAEFAQIAEVNPRVFLGLPDAAGAGMRRNVRRHVAFLERHRDRVGAEPTPWVRAVSAAAFSPTRANPRWSPNNRAHVATFKFLRFEAKQIPERFHQLGFDGAGKLRLRQLRYFQREHEDAGFFAQRKLENAMNLDVFLTRNGATYEGDFDRGAAVERLAALFGDGDRTLADAAASVDAIYLFPTETQ